MNKCFLLFQAGIQTRTPTEQTLLKFASLVCHSGKHGALPLDGHKHFSDYELLRFFSAAEERSCAPFCGIDLP